MIAAKLANMRQGARTDIQHSENLPEVSQTDAAKLMNVSDRSIRTAKEVQELVRAEVLELSPAEEAAHIARRKVIWEEITGETLVRIPDKTIGRPKTGDFAFRKILRLWHARTVSRR